MLLTGLRAARRLRGPVVALGAGAATSYVALHGAQEEYRSIPEAKLPQVYDPAAIEHVWRQHPRCVVSRVGEITRKVAPFALRIAYEYVSPPADESKDRRDARYAQRATELRELLTALGPTFIKFGQALSIRPDPESRTWTPGT